MGQSEVKIHIPQELIADTVRTEIVRQIGSNTEMVEAVIKTAMGAPSGQYSRKTVFQKAVEDMIVGEATKVFHDWLKENRDGIKLALVKYLNSSKQKRLTMLAENLSDSIAASAVSVHLDLRNLDE